VYAIMHGYCEHFWSSLGSTGAVPGLEQRGRRECQWRVPHGEGWRSGATMVTVPRGALSRVAATLMVRDSGLAAGARRRGG
jgi:hypothetical protein